MRTHSSDTEEGLPSLRGQRAKRKKLSGALSDTRSAFDALHSFLPMLLAQDGSMPIMSGLEATAVRHTAEHAPTQRSFTAVHSSHASTFFSWCVVHCTAVRVCCRFSSGFVVTV